MNPNEQIIVALDFPEYSDARKLLLKLPDLSWVKVGMELYYREGPQVVADLKDLGYRVFLDLKLHDIPNTVSKATKVLARLGVDMLNFHASGGRSMLQAAVQAANAGANLRPLLIAVTQLTSTDQRVLAEEIGVEHSLQEIVLRYASLAQSAGLDGVVCSAQETALLKRNLGHSFLTVTPGIRLAASSTQDQKRVMTPEEAIASGSDFLVIGRPLTQASDPLKVWEQIVYQISNSNRGVIH